MRGIPAIERVTVYDLSPAERDRLLSRLLQVLGYEIQACKWDGEQVRDIDLVRPAHG